MLHPSVLSQKFADYVAPASGRSSRLWLSTRRGVSLRVRMKRSIFLTRSVVELNEPRRCALGDQCEEAFDLIEPESHRVSPSIRIPKTMQLYATNSRHITLGRNCIAPKPSRRCCNCCAQPQQDYRTDNRRPSVVSNARVPSAYHPREIPALEVLGAIHHSTCTVASGRHPKRFTTWRLTQEPLSASLTSRTL